MTQRSNSSGAHVRVASLSTFRSHHIDTRYDIHDNFFFMADGWKMDYGGHDSKFTDNVVYGTFPRIFPHHF